MPDYRRVFVEGGYYFFTVVTYQRRSLLTREISRSILKNVWLEIKSIHPFEDIAICLLPDHVHCVWKLPDNDSNYPVRWNGIKGLFTKRYKNSGEFSPEPSLSRLKKKEATIWQRRYWEHVIRNDEDLYSHIDYIHYNPVKHGFVKDAREWPYSTIHRYIRQGLLDPEWGSCEPRSIKILPNLYE